MKLEYFEIIGFNLEQDVKIKFTDNRKILIAENGSGKTTILNILFLCLKYDLENLKKYSFQKCILKFDNDRKIVIDSESIAKHNKTEVSNIARKSRKRLTEQDFEESISLIRALDNIANVIFTNKGSVIYKRFLINYLDTIYSTKTHNKSIIIKKLVEFFNEYELRINENAILSYFEILSNASKSNLDNLDKILNNHFIYSDFNKFKISTNELRETDIFVDKSHQILLEYLEFFKSREENNISSEEILKDLNFIFLPTYRRIENNLEDLLSDKKALKEGTNISFGLEDVNLLFEVIKKTIQDSTILDLAKLNEIVINDVLSNKNRRVHTREKFNSEVSYVSKVIDKVGNHISPENRKRLLAEIETNSIEKNSYLWVYLSNLYNIYDKRMKFENEITKFVNVCNKYFENKTFVFDSDKLSFNIELNKSKKKVNDTITLSSLSSGEKQIVSIFAKLYLLHLVEPNFKQVNKDNNGYWIIFDEPELSLSVKWQRMFLEDIWKSGKCDFLFATTHSPFIFDNDFKYYTSHLKECLTEL